MNPPMNCLHTLSTHFLYKPQCPILTSCLLPKWSTLMLVACVRPLSVHIHTFTCTRSCPHACQSSPIRACRFLLPKRPSFPSVGSTCAQCALRHIQDLPSPWVVWVAQLHGSVIVPIFPRHPLYATMTSQVMLIHPNHRSSTNCEPQHMPTQANSSNDPPYVQADLKRRILH